MSSISVTPVALPARRPLRLTHRGRAVFAGLAAAPLIAGLLFASVTAPASAGNEQRSGSAFATVTVTSGDSLWSIAERIAPRADPRDVVAELKRLNALDDSAVLAGQTIAIPAQYSQ
ncbi:LysM peptidoglycan-binding domain-containing protein [Naasia sp. SYSU D00948]|uniref:LysM peptidoglycan-binding domain-containing protein n=1 Tax=Naasia sp. SYSU D00948 TaxID=2817379 RepID=UPI0027DC9CDC|nr:LysM peptidoglycan-binding domain-containing protein [Naasia sp. SYSU D00948]